MKFKNKSGKACVPSGYTDTDGYVGLNFETNKVKPKSSGKFTVKNKKSPYTPGLKATVDVYKRQEPRGSPAGVGANPEQ